ncbi:MAG: VOC family protein [Hyphomicrobiaceae bacterium]
MSTFIEQLKPLHVDHVAVTTAKFEDTVRDYLAMPGARIQRGPGFNPSQRVRFAFVRLDAGLVIEVLGLPESGESPIEAHVARGGGAYHICYAVADLEASLARAESAGARMVVPPKPDPAHDGRPVAFLVHPAHGLVELVAAYPVEFGFAGTGAAKHVDVETLTPARSRARAAPVALETDLVAAFKAVLPKLDEAQIRNARLGTTPGWDSLAQIQLTMEVERRLGIRIPMRQIEKLTTFEAFVAHAATAAG